MKKNYRSIYFLVTRKFEGTYLQFLLLFSIFIFSNSIYSQQSYTFTPCTATGVTGPTQTQANTSYTSTNLSGNVTVASGIQTWTVPVTGGYKIEAYGAQGGNSSTSQTGGLGAYIKGEFNFTAGTVLNISVGQLGTIGTLGGGGGGGGGGSGVRQGTAILVVAGGGGGAGMGGTNGLGAPVTTNGGASSTGIVLGGTNGNGGGAIATNGGGVGGGGILTAGTDNVGTINTPGAGGFGGAGGVSSNQCSGLSGVGGFGVGGGGGGESQRGGSGGGGGYSGGAGGEWQMQGWCSTGIGYGGGGGGSFNAGTTPVNTGSLNTGDGKVIITELCNITISSQGTNSLGSICSGSSVTLTTNAVSNYSWNTGATTSSIVVSPTSTTVYSLSATSVSNCTAYQSATILVSSGQPTLSISTSTTQLCLGKTATLTATGAIGYTWTGGVTNGASFFPSATSSYTVTGQNGCGTATAVTSITVAPLPVSVVSTGTAVCTNKTATLSVTAAATSYTWQPGNTIGANTNLIVNPQVNTIYTVTATDGTCSGIANISIQADPVPTITSSSSFSVVCPGGSINLSATGGINYTWMPGSLSGANISVSPTISTLYTVIGDNTFGCLNNSSQVIVVGTQPNVVVNTSNSAICQGGSATLTASGTHTYSWAGGPTTTVYVVTPTQSTVYTVVGTNTSSTCSDTKTISVDVFDPTVTVTGNFTICNGGSSNLTANAIGATSYTWNPGNILFQNTSLSPPGSTAYTVSTISSTNNLNCPISGTVLIVVNPNPTVTAVPTKPAICAKETNTITANGASTYTWIATNTTATVVGPSVTVTSNNAAVIIYTVTGVNTFGCEASVTVPMSISACVGLDQEALSSKQLMVYPNPNNGEFVIQSATEMKLSLINELGQEIKQIQLNERNNFKVSIIELPNGIYFITGNDLSRKIIINK